MSAAPIAIDGDVWGQPPYIQENTMGAPLKPRQRKQLTMPKRARHGQKNALKRLWDDPVTRPMMLAQVRQAAKKAGRPMGVADGTTKEQIEGLRKKAEQQAEIIMKEMEDEGLIEPVEVSDELLDDDKAQARAVMKEALVIALTPGNKQTKMTAIRTVLEYTKAKPASTTNTNLNAAEDFLAALAAKGE